MIPADEAHDAARCASNGPFAYLHDCVRAELREARAAGILGAERFGKAFEHVPVTELVTFLYYPEWHVRATAVQSLADASRDGVKCCIEAVLQLAFDDPDARVRGAAWLALARMRHDEQSLAAATSLIARAFIDRFHARPESHAHLEPAARLWLSALQEEVGRPESEEASAQLTDACLEALAGSDGARIAALRPDQAAAFLDHPDSGHRVAALYVLSIGAEAPGVRAASIRRLTEVIGASEAEKFIHRAGAAHGYAISNAPTPNVQHYGGHIRHMISSDPDLRVRCAAVQALGFLYFGSADVALEGYLADIAINQFLPDQMRCMACQSLAMVRGLRVSDWPISRALRRSGRGFGEDGFFEVGRFLDGDSSIDVGWETDVDWTFVERCARSHGE